MSVSSGNFEAEFEKGCGSHGFQSRDSLGNLGCVPWGPSLAGVNGVEVGAGEQMLLMAHLFSKVEKSCTPWSRPYQSHWKCIKNVVCR